MTEVRPMPAKPGHDATLTDKIMWLVQTHAFYKETNRVVELYRPHDACTMQLGAFMLAYAPWYEEVIGPRGGIRREPATGAWQLSEARCDVDGIRMAPHRGFPTFMEDGHRYKNTYLRPQHLNAEAGDVRPFLEFMERLLPDGREREWFFDWLAHKLQHPEIPGTCVVMVAAEKDGSGRYGTGRGMLFRILYKLFGDRYTTNQEFNMLDGSNSQHIFNDWMHNSILATVDEARTSATAHRRGERRSGYEVLKSIVDPAPKKMQFKTKYGATFTGHSHCSFIIATNHNDAVAIVGHDRRFTVLRNGPVMTRPQREELAAWSANPANIAALAQWLDVDLEGFDMMQPLQTEAKAEMAELAISQVEEAVNDLAEDDSRGLVFTRHHFENEVVAQLSGEGDRGPLTYWKGEIEGVWRQRVKLLKTAGSGRPVTIRIDGRNVKLYAFAGRLARALKLSEVQRRQHAAKWGRVDGGMDLNDLKPG
jgi:Family of unknown function (DUF5906)